MDQDVCLFSRKRMELSGIDEVESFTEEQITLSSSMGMIAVEGSGMKIESFSVETGKIAIIGQFDSFYYYASKESGGKGGILSRLFR